MAIKEPPASTDSFTLLLTTRYKSKIGTFAYSSNRLLQLMWNIAVPSKTATAGDKLPFY